MAKVCRAKDSGIPGGVRGKVALAPPELTA